MPSGDFVDNEIQTGVGNAERYAMVNWFEGSSPRQYALNVEVGTAAEIEKRFADHDKVSRALFRDFTRRAKPGDMVMIDGKLIFRKAADSD